MFLLHSALFFYDYLIQIPNSNTCSNCLPSTMISHTNISFPPNATTFLLFISLSDPFFYILQQNILSSHSDHVLTHRIILGHPFMYALKTKEDIRNLSLLFCSRNLLFTHTRICARAHIHAHFPVLSYYRYWRREEVRLIKKLTQTKKIRLSPLPPLYTFFSSSYFCSPSPSYTFFSSSYFCSPFSSFIFSLTTNRR